jgi:tetratricopeptide (TPR) repeat protein
MRTTASYNLFPDAPTERAMVRARWLAREGRAADAEAAYRGVLREHPDFKDAWAEYFELLRRERRLGDALHLAEAAVAQFGATGFAHTLRGAALLELGRTREAIAAFERALEHDPDLALAWHELGLAAYRLGDGNRALLALDRAFALEPHTETLKLRGRVLRDAGRYTAAEVAFEGAAQAAEHDEQRGEAEREIAATRRYGFYAPRRPGELDPAERWFAETGSVVLAVERGPVPPGDATLVEAFLELARDRDWRFGQVVPLGPSLPEWLRLAAALDAPLVTPAALDTAAAPLVTAIRPLSADPAWRQAVDAVTTAGAGLVFVLDHPAERPQAADADVIGILTDGGERRACMPSPSHALSDAQHPAARAAGRRFAALSPATGAPS